MIYNKISDTQYEVCDPVSDFCSVHNSVSGGTDAKEEEKKSSPPKPTACATVQQEWKEVTLKSGKTIPLLQEVKFCAEGDTYIDAKKSAEANAQNFLDKIEQEKQKKTEEDKIEEMKGRFKQPGEM